MEEKLRQAISHAVETVFGQKLDVQLSRPDPKFGDFATNVALVLAAKLGENPMDIAGKIIKELKRIELLEKPPIVKEPGFINMEISDSLLRAELDKMIESKGRNYGKNDKYINEIFVLEHTDPNPFKDFHIGHAYSNTIGAAIGKLLEAGGAKVHQVSYHGDVGLHIAMALWEFGEDFSWDPVKLETYNWPQGSSRVLGLYYKRGAEAYRTNPNKKIKIEELNSYIYTHLGDRDDPKMKFYYFGRERSFRYFDFIYDSVLGTPKFGGSKKVFERQYFESKMIEEGTNIVHKNLNTVFEKSDGAIIYDGEHEGLHKRVFITSKNLPTYETKEIGLAFAKERDFPEAHKFIVITANEIDDYFRVLVAAISKINPKLASKIIHKSHGVVKLSHGKMSSRTGQVVSVPSVDSDIGDALKKLYGKKADKSEVIFGAMKYTFLKHRLGEDLIYDPEETMSLEGNSGPYLQYAYARAIGIIKKMSKEFDERDWKLDPDERKLLVKMTEYPEVILKATTELMPHYVCTYLYELAQAFNRFYETSRVLGHEREPFRLTLVAAYAGVLENGLNLLNIKTLEEV